MVEVVIASLIAGALLVPALDLLGYVSVAFTKQAVRDKGILLATDLMSEILRQPFEDASGNTGIGPDSGESSRSQFDDVDDYHGFTESPPTDGNGTTIDGSEGFTRLVTVEYLNQLSGSITTGTSGSNFYDSGMSPGLIGSSYATDSNLKVVTIEVYYERKLVHRLQSVVSRYGLGDLLEPTGQTPESISTSIRLQNQNQPVSGSIDLLNNLPLEN